MCSELIGRRYEYGGDDCIHLVVDALKALGKNPPDVADHWYELGPRGVLRELAHYCDLLDAPVYDGDIILFGAKPPEFGIQWQSGALFINPLISAVDWKPLDKLIIRRSYRMKSR